MKANDAESDILDSEGLLNRRTKQKCNVVLSFQPDSLPRKGRAPQ